MDDGAAWLAREQELSEAVQKVLGGMRDKHMDASVLAECKKMAESLHVSVHSILDTAHLNMWSELHAVLGDVTRHHARVCAEVPCASRIPYCDSDQIRSYRTNVK